ncbi:MAG: response regulator transcription factor [Gammaproteobacteria bacterium]
MHDGSGTGGDGVVVYIIDDDPGIRDATSVALEALGLETRSYQDVDAFLADVDHRRGGCILLDVRLPGTSGLALQTELEKLKIDLPVIMMSGKADVTTAVMAMRQGAIDFLEKPFAARQLLECVQEGLEIDKKQRGERKAENAAQRQVQTLTAREREVLDELVQGLKNKEIAARLHLSVRTVEVHRANVLTKLGAKSLPDLVRIVQLAAAGEVPAE